MDAKTFFQKVVLMRKAQRDYYKNRTQDALRYSKAIEAEIDREIARVHRILSGKDDPQEETLFND